MAIYWRKETKPQPGNRPGAWYFQDYDTEHTHMRVVWLDDDTHQPGWYFQVISVSTVPRKTPGTCCDTMEEAKMQAIRWWAKNKDKHLSAFV